MEQFLCPTCGAEFSIREQLDRHVRQHIEDTRPAREMAGARSADLRCPRCFAEFSTHEELDRHLRAQHRVQ